MEDDRASSATSSSSSSAPSSPQQEAAQSLRSLRQPKKPIKYVDTDGSDSDSDAYSDEGSRRRKRKRASPLKKKKKKTKFIDDSPSKARGGDGDSSSESGDDANNNEDPLERAARRAVRRQSSGLRAGKKQSKVKLLENCMKANKWWEVAPLPDKIKWMSLEHNGVQFPPPYEPHGVPLVYDGVPIELTPEQEELATYYAACIGSQQLEKETTAKVFNRNFFSDFQKVLGEGHVINDFYKCNFDDIRAHLDAQREAKKNMPKEQREALKQAEAEQKLKYCFAIVDGCLTKVANTLIEPPGLFRGRGEHPKAGLLKPRIMPEDITLNLGQGAPVPPCPVPGHSWGNIVTNQETTWLASWKDMSGNNKYVYLSASSHFKGMADRDKYEKARQLKLKIPSIRSDYADKMKSQHEITRQIATATWVIDRLALRVGGEKDEDEADTVGTCSLRCEHMTITPPSTITLDFLGKDSMRHFETYNLGDRERYGEAGMLAFQNFERFTRNKKSTEQIFDKIEPTTLNDHLKRLMSGLSAKVFRTYNASVTLEKELPWKAPLDATLQEKESMYNDANRQVAILCNHQKSVSKATEAGLEKKHGLIEELEGQVDALRAMLKRRKHDKDIELRGDVDEDDKEAKRKTAHLFERQPTVEQVEARLVQFEKRLELARHKTGEAEKNKSVALGTSKINYMDPRISVAWCKRNEVPIEKVYSATQREKFPWAMAAEESFRF